jgi:paired amphipathic helix protein Sin3a
VKTYIGNKATYNAFLKVLNLFSQQIVDQNVLVSRVESFIGGNKELFDWFKNLVGYDGQDDDVEEETSAVRGSSSYTQQQQQRQRSKRKESAAGTAGCGPSYRHTPKAWQNRSCSGRDALCWDVLNDTYISHPTWASEDTGFVAAKKNRYEEALHRVEEERYDYDLNIEANLNTIALLEPIAKKISIMSPDEKGSFRLSPGLGSPSRTIYQRIIKKIYGIENGLEIIELLHNNPAQTVPIVLKRLKQKDDEWKRAQREWNKIWREVEAKNYWKSLDYQGITFKMTDRKAMTTKALVAQAERERADEQMNRVIQESTSVAPAATTTKPQFNYTFTDLQVFKDVSRLIYFFLTRQPVYNPEDCESMRVFMNTMIPLFFDVQDVEPSTADGTSSSDIIMEEVVEGDEDDKSSIQSMESSSQEQQQQQKKTARRRGGGNSSGRRGRGQLNDDDGLLKDVLTRNLKKPVSQQSSDDDDDDDEDEVDGEDSEQDSEQDVEDEDGTSQDANDDDEDEEDDSEHEGRRPRRRAAAAQAAAARNARRNKKRTSSQTPQLKKKVTPPKMATVASLIEKEIHHSEAVAAAASAAQANTTTTGNERMFNFFGDNGFYCFFRLYQQLYDRLLKMKELDAEFRKNPELSAKASEEAHELGITPRRFKALKMDTKRGYYNLLLALIDKLFENDIDQQTFEECVRYTFGASAHVMFTIDKLVLSIVRHVSA